VVAWKNKILREKSISLPLHFAQIPRNCPGSKPVVATDLPPCATAKDCFLECSEFSSEGLCFIVLCCKLHIHDIYYYTYLHFQASSLQPTATGYRFMPHLACLWCRTVTFYKVKSVVNTRAGYNMKSRTSSVIALRIWTCASGCFLHWSEGKTRKLKCLYSSHCSFDLELPQYSTCILYPPERLRRILFQYGFNVLISEPGGYLQKAVCCWTAQSLWIQDGLKTEEWGSIPDSIKKFLFSGTFTPTLQPIQFPIQWVSLVLY